MTQHRFSEPSVLRFVSIFHQLCDLTVPQRLTFDPLTTLSISTETAVARIRDAAHAIINGRVVTTVDPKELALKWPLYKVLSSDTGHVIIAPKTEKQTKPSSVAEVLVGQPQDVLAVVKSEDVDIIRAFALLLSRRLLKGRVQFVGDMPYAQSLVEEFDVALIEEQGNQYLI